MSNKIDIEGDINSHDSFILDEILKSEVSPDETLGQSLMRYSGLTLKQAKESSFIKRGVDILPMKHSPIREVSEDLYTEEILKNGNGEIETVSKIEPLKPLDASSIYIPEGEE